MFGMKKKAPAPAVAAADEQATEMPAVLLDVLRNSPVARDLYDTLYQQNYAWLESNELEGAGADLEARRAAYLRYSSFTDRGWRLRAAVTAAHDAFITKEIVDAAWHQAYATYQIARAVLLDGGDGAKEQSGGAA